MKILLCDAFDESLPGRLKRFGEVSDNKDELPEAEIALIRSKTKMRGDLLDSCKSLKMIIRGGVGLDNVDLETCQERGIIVRNTPEASSIAVAEMAMALMLAVPNNIVAAQQSMSEGKWEKKQLKRTELFGKTLGLLGLGRIGREVAKRAASFRMQIMSYDRLYSLSDYAFMVSNADELYEHSDYLSIHLPLTPATEGAINAENIAKMKDGVVVINTSRGKIVDSAAMAEALKAGKVRCYATDVWVSDPPPADDPLLGAPNMLMAPHIGASTQENLLRIGDTIEHLIAEYTGQHKF
jgi:D-3-phosphoglycerate dehydrogenase